jgi:toxin ParE1/3/4
LDVILAPSARTELAEIWSSIAIDDPDAADRAIDRIVAGLGRLAQFPFSGRARNELTVGLRSYSIRPRHTIFYRIRGERLEVVHVLHHARDVSRFFPDE